MLKEFSYKMLLGVLLMVPLTLGTGSLVRATPEPPTGDKRLHGPAIVGTAILDGTNLTFTGNCKGQPVVLNGPLLVNLATLTADDVEGTTFVGGTSSFPQCYSVQGDLIVNTVTRFSNNGVQASAEVVVLALVSP